MENPYVADASAFPSSGGHELELVRMLHPSAALKVLARPRLWAFVCHKLA